MDKPLNNPNRISTRANYWFRSGGILLLISRLSKLAIYPVFYTETYYLVKHDIGRPDLDVKMPKTMANIKMKVIRTRNDIIKLTEEGLNIKTYSTVAKYMDRYEDKLDAGGILFCAFSGSNLVHTQWSFIRKDGLIFLHTPPLCINFTIEAYIGGVYTLPEYRGLGLRPLLHKYLVTYLSAMGIKTLKGSIMKDNSPSLSIVKKADGVIYGEIRQIRLLFWRIWKEKIYNK